MHFFILKLNSVSYTVTSVGAGPTIAFSAQSQLEEINFSRLEIDDLIAVYLDAPIASVNAVWKVVGDVVEKSFTFVKVFETSVGCTISAELQALLATNLIVDINEESFKSIRNRLCDGASAAVQIYSTNSVNRPHQRIVFGAPGVGKSNYLSQECGLFFIEKKEAEESLKEEILAGNPIGNQEPWFNHLGMKYANYIYPLLRERTEEQLMALWGVTQNQLWKMKTAAQATIDYKHHFNTIDINPCNYERVTFHPNYSYAQFVGTYKPIQDAEDESKIVYEYVPGPFMRIYCLAKRNPNENFLLLIEEINRANVAAVFGDVFQLLDRKNGASEYPIAASEDVQKFLRKHDIEENILSIPPNMYIWATMNSADQGVFPMDTAFKRRWEFEYIDINHNVSEINSFYLPTCKKNNGGNVSYVFENWNSLRKKLNDKLQFIGVNEDKLLGPFFINRSSLEEISRMINPQTNPDGEYIPVEFQITADDAGVQNKKKIEAFQKSFESKVLMYLYEDMRMYRPDIFQIKDNGKNIEKPRLSQIFDAFENDGIKIFNFSTDRS